MGGFLPKKLLRAGSEVLLEGTWDGVEAIAKVVPPSRPWVDPASTFVGGRGLVPPFKPLVLHEADAWAAVDPTRVLHAGEGPGGLWLVLRRLPRSEAGRPGAERLLVDLLGEVARLHAADVLHRDLRPANVLWTGERTVVLDLDLGRVAGLGAVGLVGSRAWRAPEMFADEPDARADLYGVGRLVAALAEPTGEGARLVEALTAPDPADRPRSAAEALGSLGIAAPAPRLSPPHPWSLTWWRWVEAELVARSGDPWDLVRLADRESSRIEAVAAVAGRLLAAAPATGAQGWLALSATCVLMHQHTKDDLYLEQAGEARFHARAEWHPAAAAVQVLTTPASESRQRVVAAVDLQLRLMGLEEAVRTRDAAGVALAAQALGDDDRVERALRRAGRRDSLAATVAATRVLRLADSDLPDGVARQALPADQLEAVRRHLSSGDEALATRLAASLDVPQRERAELIVALAQDDRARAKRLAVSLARSGQWDPTVAALVYDDPTALDLRATAQELLLAAIPVPGARPPAAHGLAGIAVDPDDPGRWVLALDSLAQEGRIADLITAVGLSGVDHGVAPWVLLATVLLEAGFGELAAMIVDEGAGRFPDSVAVDLMRSAIALAEGDVRASRSQIDLATVSDPAAPATWLARALVAPDRKAARDAIETARMFGADASLVEWVTRQVDPRRQSLSLSFSSIIDKSND